MVKRTVLQRGARVQNRHRRVIVERDRGQQRPRKSAFDQGQGLEAKGLPPQLQAVFHCQARGQRQKPVQHGIAHGDRAQARLPRQGQGVVGGGDAVGGQLAVGFQQGRVQGKINTGARHQLAFKGIAVDVDNSRR